MRCYVEIFPSFACREAILTFLWWEKIAMFAFHAQEAVPAVACVKPLHNVGHEGEMAQVQFSMTGRCGKRQSRAGLIVLSVGFVRLVFKQGVITYYPMAGWLLFPHMPRCYE